MSVLLALVLLASVSMALAWHGGAALGRAILRRQLRDPRNAYRRDFR